MKHRYITCCTFLGLAPLISRFTDYVQGFSGGHFMFLLFPVSLYILLAAFICLLIAITENVRSVFRKRRVRTKITLLGASIFTFFTLWSLLPSPTTSFLKGFTARIQQTLTLKEIERIATLAQKHIPDGAVIWNLGNTTSGPDPDNIVALKSFSTIVDLSHLPTPFTISHRDGVVQITWGGALTGHWGFRYSESNMSRRERDYSYDLLRKNLTAFYTD